MTKLELLIKLNSANKKLQQFNLINKQLDSVLILSSFRNGEFHACNSGYSDKVAEYVIKREELRQKQIEVFNEYCAAQSELSHLIYNCPLLDIFQQEVLLNVYFFSITGKSKPMTKSQKKLHDEAVNILLEYLNSKG